MRSPLENQTLAAREERSDPENPRRTRVRKDLWGHRPHPNNVTFSSRARLRRTFRSAGATSSSNTNLISHPLTEDGSHDDSPPSAEDTPAYTRMRIEGRRGRRAPIREPPAEKLHRPLSRPRAVFPLQAYQTILADQRGRLTAWRWKRELHSPPLEVAMQRVRRALRKSPEAAKALVNKMWDRSHQRRRVQDRPPSTYATRAEQLAEAKRVAREPQDRREGQRRMALWHLLSHEERQRTPFPFDISSADPNATWRELSSLEQREAIDASTPGSTPGTRSWESMGLQRAATRSSNPLCTLDTEWRSGVEGTLAAAQDEEGPLLLVFYATLPQRTHSEGVGRFGGIRQFLLGAKCQAMWSNGAGGTEMRATLADGSVKITGATAYTKFNTHTTTGTYTENALALQKERGNDGPRIQPAWILMAQKSQGDETSAFAATTIDSEHPVPAADTEDADVSPEWTLKFQNFWGPEYEKEMTTTLPDIDGLRHDPQDEADIHLDPELSKKGPPCQRIYKNSLLDGSQTWEPKELRLVIDYRLLNRQTVKDKYPLPDILKMMFDEMQGAKFFSSFDAVDGFWRVPMAPGDVEKTAFTTQMGSYEWLVIPQGLQNSPSQYQRRMQRALGHLPFVRIFIDDVVVFSNTIAEHHEHAKQLLLACREKGVFLKRSKCQLLKKSLRFLDHCISANGCRPQHDTVAAVRDWPEMETVTHVRQFLGLAGYYRRFIHRFSEIAQPLTRLTKSDVPWEWGPMQQWAFEELKTALTSAPVLALPNIKGAADGSAPFVVQTDASGIALGGVLMQDSGDGNGLRAIAYESRQFSAAEQNYHTGEWELGALQHCTTVTWRHYLIFTNFRIQGDHRPLEWLMMEPGRELSRRQARWCMDLMEVGVPRMEYIKGALLLVPNAFSRRPDFKDKDARD
eukprot:gene4590-biopygen4529